MEEVLKGLKVSIEDVVNAADEIALDRLMSDQAAQECGYHSTLDVSFDYWHFGRHAEHAAEQRMYALAALFSAAWQVRWRVIGNDDRVSQAAEKRAIVERYRQQMKEYAEMAKTAQEAAA